MTGPTGVGKSVFAVELAHRLDGEIVGADAYQVYAGLRILTAQPDLAGKVPHHLIGFLPPTESFDAAAFFALATEKIAEIRGRGRRPIVVGGTGLYLKALTHGLDAPAPGDPAFREEIQDLPLEELVRRLDEADPEARLVVDLQNPRRVQRALEIVHATGRPLAESRRAWNTPGNPDFCGLLLTRERPELDDRIAINVDRMFAEGVVHEVGSLGTVGPTAERAIGFREIRAMLDGRLTESACREAILLATRQYAKRQLTWFRNQFNFTTIDLTGQSSPNEALSLALAHLGSARVSTDE